MKRSLFIAIVVLLMAALFVSCNADKAVEDQLFEVTIDGGARTLQVSGTSTAPEVEQLFWYYSAHKVSGLFRTGETSWKAVQSTAGISGASLGSFSKGDWTFCFYGFTEPQDATEENPLTNPKATAVYYQEALGQNISQAVVLNITLTKGTLAEATIGFVADGITWTYAKAGAGLNLEMEILDGNTLINFGTETNPITRLAGTDVEGSAGSYVFKLNDSLALDAGPHDFKVKVYYIEGTTEELVGETPITITAIDGMQYLVSGSVDLTDELKDVSIGGADAPVTAVAPVVIQSNTKTDVVTDNTPAGTTGSKTTVSFPDGALSADTSLTVETSSYEAVSTKGFAVTAGETAVAAINLSLADNTTSFNGKAVTITTFIEKNLTNVAVHYNGTGDAPSLVKYEASTGELVFTTTHFSEYYVTSKSIAMIGDKAYPTLNSALAAVQDGNTITLLQDAYIWTVLGYGKDIIIDMGGNTLSGGFDVYDGEVTLKNGTYAMTASTYLYGKATAVNNFSVLTIEKDVNVVAGNDWAIILWPCEADGQPGYGVVLNVYGTVDATEHADAIWVTGNCASGNSVINIYDGAKVNAKEMGIALNGFATVNIEEGAEITSETATAIEVRAGNLNIAGGTFTATTDIDSVEVNANGSGTTTKGAAIAIAQHTTRLPINVVIDAGSFTGTSPLFFSDPEDGDAVNVSITVNGGSFNGAEAPEAIVREGGLYASLQAAIDSVAKNNETPVEIRLLRDVKDTAGLATQTGAADANPKKLIIDFGGHTYSMKTPAVGSTGTETQSMHWSAGSVITMRNGFYAVQNDAVGVKMGMQNYANLTVEDMVLDLRAVPAGCYGENEFDGAYAIPMPMTNCMP